MEDILDLYAQEHDPDYPLLWFDEHPIQLIDHIIEPLPAQPGRIQRYDYLYKRMGGGNLFLFCATAWMATSAPEPTPTHSRLCSADEMAR